MAGKTSAGMERAVKRFENTSLSPWQCAQLSEVSYQALIKALHKLGKVTRRGRKWERK